MIPTAVQGFKVPTVNINPHWVPLSGTLPAVVADAELLPCEVAVAVIGAATVVPAVRDVAGLALPVLVALTVHSAGRRVARRALSMSRAVVRTRVDPGQRKREKQSRCLFFKPTPSGVFLIRVLIKIN